jgi:hypothetical protein
MIYKWIVQGAKNNRCVQSSTCDVSNVTFSGTISSILSTNCYGCHAGNFPSGGIDLTSYADASAVAKDGRLHGAVNHLQGYEPMPQNTSRLDDCTINKIEKWISDGAPNN